MKCFLSLSRCSLRVCFFLQTSHKSRSTVSRKVHWHKVTNRGRLIICKNGIYLAQIKSRYWNILKVFLLVNVASFYSIIHLLKTATFFLKFTVCPLHWRQALLHASQRPSSMQGFLFFFYLNSWLCCLHIASNPEGHTVSYIKRKKRQNIYNGYLEAKWNYRLKVLATEKVEHLKLFKCLV